MQVSHRPKASVYFLRKNNIITNVNTRTAIYKVFTFTALQGMCSTPEIPTRIRQMKQILAILN